MHSTQNSVLFVTPEVDCNCAELSSKDEIHAITLRSKQKSNKELIRKKKNDYFSFLPFSSVEIWCFVAIINARQRRAYLRDFRSVGFEPLSLSLLS